MSEVKAPAKRPRGRPPGAKNKKTLEKERLQKKALAAAELRIAEKLVAIVEKLCDKAEKGDTTAAKLILDRFMPTVRASEERASANPTITINITASEVETNGQITIDQENSETDHATESGTDRPQLAGPTSAHVIAFDGGAEGHGTES